MGVGNPKRDLDRLIERRYDLRDGEAMRDPAYAEGAGRYDSRRREKHREAWRSFHLRQAERIERAAAGLVEEHRRRAEELLGAWDRGEGVAS